jgi:hypothetical protein
LPDRAQPFWCDRSLFTLLGLLGSRDRFTFFSFRISLNSAFQPRYWRCTKFWSEPHSLTLCEAEGGAEDILLSYAESLQGFSRHI